MPAFSRSELADKLERGFQAIGDALGELDVYRGVPAGRLRINVPRDASRLLLGPILPVFFAAYPDVRLEITVEDRLVDIVADGYDAGTVPQDMVAVPLTRPLRWVVVGSPDYLSRRGRPSQPADLMRHACVRK
ncbi:MAG: LysR family transcriptional regulator [Hydrocarboniphaga sp.]|nr:LysR substrate-binding domain-containing protein [Hydrocarboniphaga sp.]MDB5969054.1 LysR family transcriptional regulator [Hydrocarboniphaga sp.]